MSGNSSVLADGSLLSRLDQQLYRLEGLLCIIGGLAVFSLMLLAVVSVGGRNLIGQPLSGYIDWIEQAMLLIAFLGIAYTQRNGEHIRMDMLVGMLKGRALWLAELISTLLMLLLVIVLLYGSWFHFERSFDFSSPMWSRDSSMDIALPLWPAKLLVPVSFAVLTLRLILQTWGYSGALLTNAKHPAALPLIEDAATQAAHEAKAVSGNEDVSQTSTAPGDR